MIYADHTTSGRLRICMVKIGLLQQETIKEECGSNNAYSLVAFNNKQFTFELVEESVALANI